MDSLQLVVVVLASVLVGALLPLLVLASLALRRASKHLAEIAVQVKRTLAQAELVSGRVEVLSRGLRDGEDSVAALLASVASLAASMERSARTFQVLSTLAATVGAAVAGFVGTRMHGGPAGSPAGAEPPAATPPDA